MAHNWYATCAKCGVWQEKKEMEKLYYSEERYSPPKVLCHLCKSCFLLLLDELEVSL